MKTFIFLTLSLLFSVTTPAKIKKSSLPEFRARFKIKTVYRGKNTVSAVDLYCSLGSCSWKEVKFDQCVPSVLSLFHFDPGVRIFSTDGFYLPGKMTVKQTPDKTFSISLYETGAGYPRDAYISKYLLKIECPEYWARYHYCKVLSLKGSMIDDIAETTSYELVTSGNMGSIKLDRCQ